MRAAIVILALLSAPVSAQQIYKCSNGKGGNTYQQTPCATQAATKGVRSFKREPDSPQGYGQYGRNASQGQRGPQAPYRSTVYADQPSAESPRADDPSGYVRCTKPSGKTYLVQGTACRARPVEQQAGMVRSLQTGEQRFMVPGGGNGMIDPATGQRYELIGVPEMRRDTAQPVSRGDACAEARAALSDPNRTMSSIRGAEARVATVCED